MNLLGRLHRELVLPRRVKVLSELLSGLMPRNATVLDVGCGDGLIDRLIGERRPDLEVLGIDVKVRSETAIPVEEFDGNTLPYEDGGVDVVLLVDVLHHADDPERLLGEALRVARAAVVMKDHALDGFLAGPTLRFMDWVGNAPHGVALPYDYWPERRWREAFARLGVEPSTWIGRLNLYPPPASWLFDRSLHFVARIDVQ